MRNILLISSAHAVNASVVSPRVGRMLKWMPRIGWDPTLLTISDVFLEPGVVRVPGDSESVYRIQVLPPLLRRFRGRTSSLASTSSTRGRAGSRVRTVLSRLHYNVFEFPDSVRDWISPGVQMGSQLHRALGFQALYSSSPDPSAHFIAYRLAGRLGIPWIHEYRDLWAGNPWRGETARAYLWRHKRELLWERRFWATSRNAVVMTQSNAAILARRMSDNATGHIEVIPNGFDDETAGELRPAISELPLRLCYTGSLYGGKRDLAGLLEAMREIRDESTNGRSPIEFVYAGPESSHVRALSEGRGIRDAVKTVGMVDALQVRELQQNAHVLILVEDASDDAWIKGNMPGKAYEYLFAKRPVLALANLDGSIAQLLTETSTGVTFHPRDRAGITQYLRSAIDGLRQGALPAYAPNTAKVNDNSWEQISQRLGAVLARAAM